MKMSEESRQSEALSTAITYKANKAAIADNGATKRALQIGAGVTVGSAAIAAALLFSRRSAR